MRKRTVKDKIVLVTGMAVSLGFLIAADHAGLPQKWHTAIFATVLPFAVVLMMYPRRWQRGTFWESFVVCLAVHLVAIFILFQYIFTQVAPGWLLWTPIAFVEALALVGFVGRIERRITDMEHHRSTSS